MGPNMPIHQANTTTATIPPGGTIPPAALDNLAARFRPAGLFLAMLRPDGTLAYHDTAAPQFFQRYVKPQLENADTAPPASDGALADKIRLTNAASGVCAWNMLPGVEIAAFPYVEKRQLAGIVLLAAKASSFRLHEDVVRACSRLGLDGIWLGQQAEDLAAYDEHSLQRQARLLLSMIRDQVRLGGLEQELDSLSGQLANTYEELSLIYQISSGMKVNRRAADFFKQTCLEVMEVLGVRGMGVALCGEKAGLIEPATYGQLTMTQQRLCHLGGELLRVLRDRKAPLLVNDVAADKNFRFMVDDAHQIIAVPL